MPLRSLGESTNPPAAIWQLATRVTETTPVRVTLEMVNLEGTLAPEFEIHFYRAVQEGMANILRHAHATTARLEIRLEVGQIRAALRDNGEGFDLAQIAGRAGLGLAGIRERMRLIDGRLEVSSRPGPGTCLDMTIPSRLTSNVMSRQ